MRSPSIEIASCWVTTRPSALKVFGACFNTVGLATPRSISSSDGGVSGSCTLASRSPLLSEGWRSSGQMSTTPICGRPPSVSRLQLVADGVQISNFGWGALGDESNKPPPGPEQALQGAASFRLEQHSKIAAAGEEGRERHAEHGVGDIASALDR